MIKYCCDLGSLTTLLLSVYNFLPGFIGLLGGFAALVYYLLSIRRELREIKKEKSKWQKRK